MSKNIKQSVEAFKPLVRLIKAHSQRGGLTLETLCNGLHLTPKEVKKLLEDAKAAGLELTVHHGEIGFTNAPSPPVHIPVRRSKPGAEQIIAVASDWHIASKHHEKQALADHIAYCADQGVVHFFAPGDLVAGDYHFLKYETTCTGIEDQSNAAAEFIVKHLPKHCHLHTIGGNHCSSFKTGINAANYIARLCKGQANVHYHGGRGGRVLLGNTRIEMHHPGGGLAYALSYKIQKHIDNTDRTQRPHFLFTGHTHQAIHIDRAGTHGFLCGTFENGDSEFGRMIGGDVALGGWLIRYRHDETDGELAHVNAAFLRYPQTRMVYTRAAGSVR